MVLTSYQLSGHFLLMAVLFNETLLGWRSQSKGTFLMSPNGDIIKEFQQNTYWLTEQSPTTWRRISVSHPWKHHRHPIGVWLKGKLGSARRAVKGREGTGVISGRAVGGIFACVAG